MKTISLQTISPQVRGVYNLFKNQVGSEHIASLYALQVIFDILQNEKPKTILELGGGLEQ